MAREYTTEEVKLLLKAHGQEILKAWVAIGKTRFQRFGAKKVQAAITETGLDEDKWEALIEESKGR